MKIREFLVDILCEMDKSCVKYDTLEGTQNVLYMHIIMAIFSLLVLAMLFYKKLVGDLSKYWLKRILTIPVWPTRW